MRLVTKHVIKVRVLLISWDLEYVPLGGRHCQILWINYRGIESHLSPAIKILIEVFVIAVARNERIKLLDVSSALFFFLNVIYLISALTIRIILLKGC